MFAILLALLSSFWFGVSMIFINRGVLTIDYFRGLLTNLGVNAFFLWIYLWAFSDRKNRGRESFSGRDKTCKGRY
jgi:hypothetical protein